MGRDDRRPTPQTGSLDQLSDSTKLDLISRAFEARPDMPPLVEGVEEPDEGAVETRSRLAHGLLDVGMSPEDTAALLYYIKAAQLMQAGSVSGYRDRLSAFHSDPEYIRRLVAFEHSRMGVLRTTRYKGKREEAIDEESLLSNLALARGLSVEWFVLRNRMVGVDVGFRHPSEIDPAVRGGEVEHG